MLFSFRFWEGQHTWPPWRRGQGPSGSLHQGRERIRPAAAAGLSLSLSIYIHIYIYIYKYIYTCIYLCIIHVCVLVFEKHICIYMYNSMYLWFTDICACYHRLSLSVQKAFLIWLFVPRHGRPIPLSCLPLPSSSRMAVGGPISCTTCLVQLTATAMRQIICLKDIPAYDAYDAYDAYV